MVRLAEGGRGQGLATTPRASAALIRPGLELDGFSLINDAGDDDRLVALELGRLQGSDSLPTTTREVTRFEGSLEVFIH